MIHLGIVVITIFLSVNAVAIEAESPQTSCDGIMRLVNKGIFKDALQEARWCVEALEASLQGAMSDFFRPNVAGWKREDVRQENVLGMGSVVGIYTKGDARLEVTLIGKQGIGSIFGGALSGLAKMGMMQGGKRFRVQRLRASIDSQGQITVTLDDGSFITVKSSHHKKQEAALKALEPFLDAFPFAEINAQRS